MSPSNYSHSIHDGHVHAREDQLLDKLDLQLKGFPEIDATPSTGITSLPTPRNEPVELTDAKEADEANEYVVYLSGRVPLTNIPPSILQPLLPPSAYEAMECPGAPRVKDLDSFTDGTGGSFDFLTGIAEDDTAPPLNSLALSNLPPQNTSLSIEMWREDVYYHSPSTDTPTARPEASDESTLPSLAHVKRPRSLASDDNVDDRRIRHRVQSDIAPSIPRPLFYDDRLYTTFPEAMPRLRRSRSLPYRPDD
ncbi:hypothetical protein D9758_003027 [Tetrapyrgos nigripes]|uniref:Uncharacterized protein n=1 Tax=Tetrapyrgos nigripes TaxID=182062 RepID=A0A8H5LTH4_9AGAR|nr:hypothetical protein D9758_003027 [Tetrapyrgos nigripes]